ncbi:MAG: PE-PGRS family protein PE_PGRS18 [uncultured marine phage]|uniref:PE-PGRS family protein PE_PGRS18 n=1 Tax=uncultured marine phage TaxID=707152 RepID=A0A8D9FQK0_9VIRU|nr:MAG: PE-PGRS family protein PE_PGRS18 [uncultured marine phage]
MAGITDENLIFFDKNGNSLNLLYNDGTEEYEGRLFFDVNSDDTFRTVTLNTFERIDAFDFQLNDETNDELFLNKFQLFNEFGVDYTGNGYQGESVTWVEPVNNDPAFYTKWVYGNNFEAKYPKGSELKFNQSVSEFTSFDKTYTVVGTKKGAAMIVSNTDNSTYTGAYSGLTFSDFDNVTVDGINSIQIKKYIDSTYEPNIADWSEPFFYDKLFVGQKLSVVNSASNDGVKTMKAQLQDNTNYTYCADGVGVTSSFIMEVTLLTDLPKVYDGNLTINGTTSTVEFSGSVPSLLRPGIEFKIPNSVFNTGFYTVDDIQQFDLTPGTLYATGSQVIWEGEIYEAIQSYTQSTSTIQDSTNLSGSSPYTLEVGVSITPEDTNYWQVSNYIPVEETMISEVMIAGQVYTTDNVFYFTQDFDISEETTLASSVETYADDLASLDITYTYDNNRVCADLNYSSRYAQVRFYNGDLSNSISEEIYNFERVIEVEENLTTENNRDISEKDLWTIVVDDLDEFGMYVNINGLDYYVDTVFVFNGVNIDLEKTIDKTLRSWQAQHLYPLGKLGIFPELIYTGYAPSSYVNTIKLNTVYPNVPIDFSVRVGSTANFIIEHSHVVIYDIGGVLNIIVNGISFQETFDTDVSTTLTNWVTSHNEFLFDLGIIISSVNQILYFDVNDQDVRVDLEIRLGKSFEPGELSYRIIKRHFGNEGAILTANEVIHNVDDVDFEDECFATGQIVSVNNSFYPINNQEYNVIFLDPKKITLSYQGPFWGNTQSDVLSGFLGYAFDDGYGYDPNAPNITTPIVSTSSHKVVGTASNLTDLIYIQPSENIFALGDDVSVADATTSALVDTLITGSGSPIKIEINPVNQLVYALTDDMVYYIDPTLQVISGTISLGNTAFDMDINDVNGDIYVSYTDSFVISIYDSSNTFAGGVSLATGSNSLEFDPNENLMFVAETFNDQVSEIDGDTKTVVGTYPIVGVKEDLYYNPFNNKVYGFNSTSMYSVSSGAYTTIPDVVTSTYSSFVYNPLNDKMYVSTSDEFMYELDGLDNVTDITDVKDYGYLLYNNLDGNIYIASNKYNRLSIYSTLVNNIFMNVITDGQLDKIVYNQYRQSIVGIIPTTNEIVEIIANTLGAPAPRSFSAAFDASQFYNEVYIGDPCAGVPISGNLFGTLAEDFCEDEEFLLLKTREYIRRPRSNFETDNDVQVQYKWSWEDDQTPEIFLYDFTGDQLDTTGSYAYTGEKPLTEIYLNKDPNRDLDKLDDPKAQQTIFSELIYTLDYVDSTQNLSFVPTPLQSHIGFNSKIEGVSDSTLLLSKLEDISFDIVTDSTNMNEIIFRTYIENDGSKWGEITIDTMSTDVFTSRNLKEGQILQLHLTDNTNDKNQFTAKNHGRKFRIRNVYIRSIIVDFIDDEMADEDTIIENYPNAGDITYLTTTFTVADKVIGRFRMFGQTEIEDIRYKIELNNTGRNIKPEEVFIFKEYDINEQGVDWTFLNKKRKEMLLVRPEIFNYIGSYKSIINAINYFGYNDLELYEYYRNINRTSENFNKLVKLEIPDIFDPTIQGWTENEFVLNVFPNAEYEETNLFNLAYRITDMEGNFVLNYSLDEVTTKLMGLKKWLESNIIPISHKILDITGRADVPHGSYIYHDTYDVQHIKSTNTMTPIDMSIDEAYILPVNSGSSVYNVSVNFSTAIEEEIPDYYTIKVKTYQIHPDWEPFETYTDGDEIRYLGKLYESVEDVNKTNNPKEFEEAQSWRADQQYLFGQVVEYNKDAYAYQVLEAIPTPGSTGSGTFSATQSSLPPYNNSDWFRVNNWREINLDPIQTIDEFRDGEDLLPFNFTLDTNIDPYVIIEVTSDNGYGQNYTVRKSVEIRLDADSSELLIDTNTEA